MFGICDVFNKYQLNENELGEKNWKQQLERQVENQERVVIMKFKDKEIFKMEEVVVVMLNVREKLSQRGI